MNCELCDRKAKNGEAYWCLSWEKVDVSIYKQRKKEGRSTRISEVCPDCIAKYNGNRPPLGLCDLNEIARLGITKEEYYQKHGY